ncbi:hypothetical protein ABH908_000159 [Pseudomonas frederiksbergensis]|uniref:hypothetical protein n=1 Tax=Pseudomonas TaxID=286 RepID=UPI003D209D04
MSHVIITPGKKWIPAAKVIAETDTKADSSVSGFYKRLNAGIRFYGLDGELFACLITNRHGVFFVTAHTTPEGTWFMHSTSEHTERMLGIEGLGYMAQKDLEQRIVDELDIHTATVTLDKHGVYFEQFVALAKQLPTSDMALQAFYSAGLTAELQGIEDDGYLLVTRIGRTMLIKHGYDTVNGKWVKVSATDAA